MNSRQVGLLSLGHLATDINQGALPAILPFFIAAFDLSFAAAAGIVFAANMTSSIVQPLFGYASDRHSTPGLLSAGLLVAGVGLGLVGICQSYPWIMVMAVVSGIGVAAYHPEAARLVNFAAGSTTGVAMSLFGVGGTIGFAVGPLLVTAALLQWGLAGTMILMVPASFMALVLASQRKAFEALAGSPSKKETQSDPSVLKENWSAFSRLTTVIIGRSIIFYALNTFIPIFWINELNQSKATGAMALSVFAGSGIIGNVLGGGLADRIGQRKVILMGFLGLCLFLPLLIAVKNVTLATLVLVPLGVMLYGTYSPSIVLGQIYLPNRIGFSSGVTLGVAVAIGGGAAPLIGMIADSHGIWTAFAAIAGLPIGIFALAWSLPDSRNIRNV